MTDFQLSGCEGNWHGIDVQSDQGIPGTLSLNDGVITEAFVALETKDESPQYDIFDGVVYLPAENGLNGGVIDCENVQFKDNLQALVIQESVNETPLFAFDKCKFEVSDGLYNSIGTDNFDPSNPSEQFSRLVKMDLVRG